MKVELEISEDAMQGIRNEYSLARWCGNTKAQTIEQFISEWINEFYGHASRPPRE